MTQSLLDLAGITTPLHVHIHSLSPSAPELSSKTSVRRRRVGSGMGRRRGFILPNAVHPPSYISNGHSDEPSPPSVPSTAGKEPAISHVPPIVPTRASCRALSPGGECDYDVHMRAWAHWMDVPCMVTYTMRRFDDNGLPALYIYLSGKPIPYTFECPPPTSDTYVNTREMTFISSLRTALAGIQTHIARAVNPM